MHDGTPCHQSKATKNWVQDQRIEVLGPCPGQSPNINPIENPIENLKMKVHAKKPTNFESLH